MPETHKFKKENKELALCLIHEANELPISVVCTKAWIYFADVHKTNPYYAKKHCGNRKGANKFIVTAARSQAWTSCFCSRTDASLYLDMKKTLRWKIFTSAW